MTSLSLAQFVFTTREKIGLSQMGLAKKCSLPIEVIDDIESGRELFLASTTRQKLAKGLRLNPSEIKPYEKYIESKFDKDEELIKIIKSKIIDGDTQDLKCPICSSALVTRIAKLYDLEDNLMFHPKANCVKCPFQIS
jgi:transcriptional regulator with XRE-family HTH domain